jgi:hypothetical protein
MDMRASAQRLVSAMMMMMMMMTMMTLMTTDSYSVRVHYAV